MKAMKNTTGGAMGYGDRVFGLRYVLEDPNKEDGSKGNAGAGAGAGAADASDPKAILAMFEKMLDGKLDAHSKSIDDRLAQNNKRAVDMLRQGAPAVRLDQSGDFLIGPGEQRGLQAGAFVRAVAAGKKFGRPVLDVAKAWKDDQLVANVESAMKTLQAQDAAGAGLLLPEPVLAEVTELLRAAVVVESSGAVSMPMPNGTLSINHQETSSTGSYGGEIASIAVSQPSYGRLKMAAKKLRALVPVSNDLLRFTGGAANTLVRDDLVRSLSVRKDLALIRDDGTLDSPKGLRWLALPANVVARSLDAGVVTLETVTDDLVGAVNRLESLNIKMVRPGWIFHPRTKNFLMKLRDGDGRRVYKEEMRGGTLEGLPFKVTTNIPVNLGTAGDESEIYLVDFASILVGESYDLMLDVADQASFTDAASGQQNGFQNDETLVRAIMAHDILARFRGQEISIITQLDWY